MKAACLLAAVSFASLVAANPPVPRPRPGWSIELVAQAPAIRHPSVVCAAPDGRIFIAEDPMDISSARADMREGRIVCLHPDRQMTTFAEGLHAVFGMQYLEGKLYVLHNPRFSVFTDANGIGRDRTELIEQTLPDPWALNWNDHVPANFRLGMDGFFYIAVGDKGLYGATDRSGRRVDLHGGGIVRIRPDGSGLEVVCTGVRNILDVALNDQDEMFTYDNTDEHEWLGRVTHMVDGGVYGYPHDFIPQRPYTLWKFADYGPGAATGIFAWNDGSLPAELRGNLILADFGQRNLRRVLIERAGGTYHAIKDELLFVEPPPDFRPVGISESADGRGILICDWQHLDQKASVTVGRLWKLTNQTAGKPAPLPGWFVPAVKGEPLETTDSELLGGLAHPEKRVRLAAQRALARRGKVVVPLLMETFTNEAAPEFARWHALWALDAIDGGQSARGLILDAARIGPANIARQAIRQLGEQRTPDAVPLLVERLKNDDASLRFAAATALGRIAEAKSVPALIEALNDQDLFARFASFTALNRIGAARPTAWRAIVAGLRQEDERVRDGIAHATRATFDPALIEALIELVNTKAERAETRAAALRALTLLPYQPAPWKGEWWAYHPALSAPPEPTVGWRGTPVILGALRGALDDEAAPVRLAGIEGVSAARDRDAAPRLRQLLVDDPEVAVRRAALATLARLKDSATGSLLAKVFRAPEGAEMLSEMIRLSPQFGGAEIGAGLCALLAARSAAEQRRLVISALGELGDASAVSALAAVSREDQAARIAALDALGRIPHASALTALRSASRSASAAEQQAITRALAARRSRDALPDLLAAWARAETRDTALAGLVEIPDLRALDPYLAGLASENFLIREKCRRALRAVAKEALPELEKRRDQLTPALLAELRTVYAQDPAALVRPLFAGAIPRPKPEEYARFALQDRGDPWRGQQIFFDSGRVACLSCHVIAGNGRNLGPDLTTIGAQLGRDALIEAILHPSKAVREGYQQYSVELHSGESFSGALRTESAETLTLVDAEGTTHTIEKARVKTRHASQSSLMPEGLHSSLSLEEFRDLIAYLQSLRTDPRIPETKPVPTGFEPLFNGRDLAGFKASPHWVVRDGILEHDGIADDLWSTRDLRDFELRLEWRWPDPPAFTEHPVINRDGSESRNAEGQPVRARVLEAGDSGVFFRGSHKAQANLFCYPIGSGEFWEYRESLSGDARRAVTPAERADRPIGQWNELQLFVRDDRVTVRMNEIEVIREARLPGLPSRGPIGFQHEHGRIQFRNIWVKELP